jgi:hypothetical protein
VVTPLEGNSSFPIVVTVRGTIASIGIGYPADPDGFEFSALIEEMAKPVTADDIKIFTTGRDAQGLVLFPVTIDS